MEWDTKTVLRNVDVDKTKRHLIITSNTKNNVVLMDTYLPKVTGLFGQPIVGVSFSLSFLTLSETSQ